MTRQTGLKRFASTCGAMAALSLLSACVTPPPPPTPAATIGPRVVKYACTGGGLTVSYGPNTATLKGPETLLKDEGPGEHYSWPSDGTHHVWVLNNGVGTLSLRDGTKGTETVEKSACKPVA